MQAGMNHGHKGFHIKTLKERDAYHSVYNNNWKM